MADLSKSKRGTDGNQQNGHNGFQSASLVPLKAPAHGDTWGRWRLDAKRLVLEYLDVDGRWQYEFDLEKKYDPTSILDFILQANQKPWATAEDVGDFVQALNDVVGDSRHVFCAFGVGRAAVPADFFKRRTAPAT